MNINCCYWLFSTYFRIFHRLAFKKMSSLLEKTHIDEGRILCLKSTVYIRMKYIISFLEKFTNSDVEKLHTQGIHYNLENILVLSNTYLGLKS